MQCGYQATFLVKTSCHGNEIRNTPILRRESSNHRWLTQGQVMRNLGAILSLLLAWKSCWTNDFAVDVLIGDTTNNISYLVLAVI